MEPIKPVPGAMPEELSRLRVKGFDHAFYELDSGNFLVIAGPSSGGDLARARRNIAAQDSEYVTDLVEHDPDVARARLGIRSTCIMLFATGPDPAPDFLDAELAWKLSEEIFGPRDATKVQDAEESEEAEGGSVEAEGGNTEPPNIESAPSSPEQTEAESNDPVSDSADESSELGGVGESRDDE